MSTPPDEDRRPVARLVGGRPVAAIAVVFVVVHVVLAATCGADAPGLEIAQLVLVCGSATALFVSGLRASPRALAGYLPALLLAAVLGCLTLRTDGVGPDYRGWVFGAVTFMLLALVAQGRVASAWLTMGGLVLIALTWGALSGQGVLEGVELVIRHVGTLLVGTLFVLGIRRANRSLDTVTAEARQRAVADRAARASASSRRQAAEAVLEQAGPMLRAVADGRRLSATDRRELVVLEGRLRDRIRAGDLATPALADAIAAARRRGVDVLLLDDAGDAAAPAARRAAASWLAEEVAAATSGRIVARVRLAPDGLRVTAVTDATSRVLTLAREQDAGAPA